MGHLFSKPINSWVLHYLRSLTQDGSGHYTVDEFHTDIPLSTFLGRENAPTCHLFILNSSIKFDDLQFDGPSPIRMKSSKITITIGKLVVRCDSLGYILRIIKGRITIFDVHITASFHLTFVNGIRVSDISAEATVKKIKIMDALTSDIQEEARWCMLLAMTLDLDGEDAPEIGSRLEKWQQKLETVGLKISRTKTEYMFCDFGGLSSSGAIALDDALLPICSDFQYLGSLVQSDGEEDRTVKHRINTGWMKWRQVTGTICDSRISLKPKRMIYKTMTEIKLDVNGTEHSRLANVLLSIDNPQVASSLLNAIFMVLMKEEIQYHLNENVRNIASQYGL